jgi:hypothetical protein
MQSAPNWRVTQLRNLAWSAVLLYLAGSCRLTRLAARWPIAGQRDSRVQRLRRFLMNRRVSSRAGYAPTAQAILASLGTGLIVLIIDRTTVRDRLNLLTLSVAYHGRSLPLAWKVFKKQGQFKRCHFVALLRFVKRLAPDSPQIWVVADREFRDVALQAVVEQELGWHYVQRITHNLWLYPRRGAAFQPRQLGLRPGQRLVVPQVRGTRQQAGPAHFLAYWAKGEAEPRYLLSDQPIDRQTVRRYARRFWVEPTYRDWKSYGWDIEASRISDPQRFELLLLGIALAYVWLLQLAGGVIKRGWRRWVDRTRRRTLSYFRLGWSWLWRWLDHDRPVTLPAALYP